MIKANSADTSLVLTGDNFVRSSTVYINGQLYATQFVNKTRIETTIPASLLTTSGLYPVNVINPGSGGGETQYFILTVSQPANTTVEPLAAGSFGKQYEDLIPLDATIPAYTAKRFAVVTVLFKTGVRIQYPISKSRSSDFRNIGQQRRMVQADIQYPWTAAAQLRLCSKKAV